MEIIEIKDTMEYGNVVGAKFLVRFNLSPCLGSKAAWQSMLDRMDIAFGRGMNCKGRRFNNYLPIATWYHEDSYVVAGGYYRLYLTTEEQVTFCTLSMEVGL